jgi:hypothetical protein
MQVSELHDNGGFNCDAQIIVIIYNMNKKWNKMYNIHVQRTEHKMTPHVYLC